LGQEEIVSIFRHRIEVGDPQGQRFEAVEALVDTGATFTTTPAAILERLGVQRERRVRFRLADDRVIERDVGETYVRLNGQTLHTLVVFGDEGAQTLLGVYTLEAALLAVDPVGQRLVPTDALMMTVL
jgi:clan AA aspartic protease